MTRSEENYLKTIYHLGGDEKVPVSTNAIAAQMETKPSSVTDMAKKLAEKNLVDYQKYQGVVLTSLGKQTALQIIRKHRLWEVFLFEKLDFQWDEVHEVAEQLEHIKSEQLIDRLDALLNYPKFDPHGDPIPGKDGLLAVQKKTLLSELEEGQNGLFVGVKDTSTSFLQYLDKNQIALGQSIRLIERESFDQSLQIEIQGRSLRLSHQIATNLYIKTD